MKKKELKARIEGLAKQLVFERGVKKRLLIALRKIKSGETTIEKVMEGATKQYAELDYDPSRMNTLHNRLFPPIDDYLNIDGQLLYTNRWANEATEKTTSPRPSCGEPDQAEHDQRL
jgi:hypothetical protein